MQREYEAKKKEQEKRDKRLEFEFAEHKAFLELIQKISSK